MDEFQLNYFKSENWKAAAVCLTELFASLKKKKKKKAVPLKKKKKKKP